MRNHLNSSIHKCFLNKSFQMAQIHHVKWSRSGSFIGAKNGRLPRGSEKWWDELYDRRSFHHLRLQYAYDLLPQWHSIVSSQDHVASHRRQVRGAGFARVYYWFSVSETYTFHTVLFDHITFISFSCDELKKWVRSTKSDTQWQSGRVLVPEMFQIRARGRIWRIIQMRRTDGL